MNMYRNGELGEAIGDTLNLLGKPTRTPRERQILVDYLRLLCELAIQRGETIQLVDDRDD